MLIENINPIIFSLGPLVFRRYGLMKAMSRKRFSSTLFLKGNLVMGIILVFLILILAGCNSPTASSPRDEVGEEAGIGEKLVVAVTIVPQETFIKKIGGDLVDIVLLVPPGNSPANYEPTPQEMERFNHASLFFTVGVPTEAANLLPRAEEIGTMNIIRLQDEVAAIYPDRELAPGRRDPHIWLSPKRARVMVEVMAREMSYVDEANKKTYEENARGFIAELDKLEKELEQTFNELPNRKFIVFHPAFGYLADDYGLEMYALEQDGKEATPQRMQEMIDLAKAENIKVIFHQKEIDSKQSLAFAEEIGGQAVQLAPLAPNYINNLRKMAETMARVLQ